MVNDGTGKYFPRIVKTNQYDCCFGDNCSTCDPSLWATGQTPQIVTATISGITECGGQCAASYIDFNDTFYLTQSGASACWWFYTSGDTVMRWTVDRGAPTTDSMFHIWTDDGAGDVDWYFTDVIGSTCQTSFTNALVVGNCCAGDFAHGVTGDPSGEQVAYDGSVSITW
jgi:hypothetical protein